jgi:hypothetical protein
VEENLLEHSAVNFRLKMLVPQAKQPEPQAKGKKEYMLKLK